VEALTDLINTCRHQARQDFAAAARDVHADAAVLTDMSLQRERDRIEPVSTAMVTITGTALGQFQPRPKRPRTLTIMPLASRDRSTHA
jgi:uncharacterized protein YbjQ (UPF0145 family)